MTTSSGRLQSVPATAWQQKHCRPGTGYHHAAPRRLGTGGAAGARQAGPRPGARLVHGPALAGARHEQEPAEPRKAHGAAGQRAGRPRVARVPAQPVRQRAAGGASGAGRQRALAGAGLRAAPDPRCASAPLTRVLRRRGTGRSQPVELRSRPQELVEQTAACRAPPFRAAEGHGTGVAAARSAAPTGALQAGARPLSSSAACAASSSAAWSSQTGPASASTRRRWPGSASTPQLPGPRPGAPLASGSSAVLCMNSRSAERTPSSARDVSELARIAACRTRRQQHQLLRRAPRVRKRLGRKSMKRTVLFKPSTGLTPRVTVLARYSSSSRACKRWPPPLCALPPRCAAAASLCQRPARPASSPAAL